MMYKNNDDFRKSVRSWLVEHFSAFTLKIDTKPTSFSYRRAWEDYLCEHGWAGLGWPSQYGGKGLDIFKQAIFHEELARIGAPLGVNLIGHGILGPTLIHYGTQAQKDRFLPAILNNTEIWCQGYSEPEAGSDLANIKTKAIPTEGGYLLSGHKIWTSFAHIADWCFVLARTDSLSERHKGLSFLLVDMKQPGVRVEPIKQITGQAEFCEVFFDQVFISQDMRVGDEGNGWAIAMAAASFERGTYFIPRLVKFEQELKQAQQLICSKKYDNPAQKITCQQQWARFAIDSYLLQQKSLRALREIEQGKTPGAESSSTKVHWSESHQHLLQFAMDLIGIEDIYQAEPDALIENLQFAFLNSKSETILAGTSEIQRTIIAEKILGLPK